jgi:hypothetical protein
MVLRAYTMNSGFSSWCVRVMDEIVSLIELYTGNVFEFP